MNKEEKKIKIEISISTIIKTTVWFWITTILYLELFYLILQLLGKILKEL